MINYIILAITIACTIFNIWLTVQERGYRSGYDKGLEDGIRMTNEVLSENADGCGRCFGASFGDCGECDKGKPVDCSWR